MASSLIFFVLSLSFHQCWTVTAHLLCLDWMDPLPLARFPLIYRRHSTWTHGKDTLASKGKIWHLYLTMFFKRAICNSTEIINNHSFCHSQTKCLFLQNSLFLKTQVGNVYANALIGAEAPVSSLPSAVRKIPSAQRELRLELQWLTLHWLQQTGSEKSFLCDSWKNPLFFCFPCLARRNLIPIEAGIPGNAWERGVCIGFALGPDNFCSNRTARVFSAVKTSCLFAGRNFQGLFNDCVTEIWTIFEWHCILTAQPLGGAVGLASGCFPALPPCGGKGWRRTNGGISSFQFSEMLKSKHFLCQRPVTKPVISLPED